MYPIRHLLSAFQSLLHTYTHQKLQWKEHKLTGPGQLQQFWTNVFPTRLVEKYAKEIKRFNTAIKVMRWTEVFWALIPIKISLKMWGFSDEFMNYMIYPRYVDLRIHCAATLGALVLMPFSVWLYFWVRLWTDRHSEMGIGSKAR